MRAGNNNEGVTGGKDAAVAVRSSVELRQTVIANCELTDT